MRAEEIKGLMEAYSQVHTPDAVDIAAEIWVSACIEEGIDFSQYTLDELTEGFIVDISSEDLSESLLSEILGMPGAQNLGAGLRQQFGKARRAVGGAIGKVAGGVKDVAGAAAQGLAGQKTTSSNPLARGYNAATRFASAPTRAAASFATGVLTGRPGATNPPAKSSAPVKPKMPGLPPSAAQPGTGPTGNKVGSKPAAPSAPTSGVKPTTSPAPKPAATATSKPTTPAAPAKPAGSAMDQWAKANPKLAAAKAERDRTRGTSATTNPLMKDMKSSMPAPKSPAPSTAKTGFDLAKKGVNLAAGVDIFDLVKGHLLDEGYADSEEGAMVIMVNMSEEWRKSILESHGVEILDEISKELALKAHAERGTREFESDSDNPKDFTKSGKSKADESERRIVKKHGEGARREANRAAEKRIYGHNKYSEAQEREQAKKKVTKEDLELDESSKTDDGTRERIRMYAGKKGISFEPGPRWDPSANRGKGANLSPKQVEKQRRKSLRNEDLEAWVDELIAEGYDLSEYTWEEVAEIYAQELELIDEGKSSRPRYPGGRGVLDQETRDEKREAHAENRKGHTAGPGTVTKNTKKLRKQKAMGEIGEEYMDEAQRARENPEDHDEKEKRKYEPVRGERTPMPPRGDKRREDFEKWYAKQMGR